MPLIDHYRNKGLFAWLNREIIYKKLISPWGIAVLVLVAVGSGFLAANNLFFIPFLLGFGIIGAYIVYCCLFKPLTGFYIVQVYAFFNFYPGHLLVRDLPLTPILELLILFLFIGTLFSEKRVEEKGSLLKTSVSIFLIFNFVLYAVEAFNPNIYSLGGWFASFKRFVLYIFVYIIAYRLINTPKKFSFFLRFWVLMSFITALYGCFQQWFGYLPMELQFIMRNPKEYELLFQGGQLRKFSFLSDVVSFGVLSGSMAVLTLLLAIPEKDKKRKYTLFFFGIIMILGMVYSGTRTTLIMLPAGIALYGFLTIQSKTTIITLFVAVMAALFVLFAPIYNPTLYRIRTTFNSKEESMNVRDRNRHYIQPYIYAHPIGGGINTSGIEGEAFYPDHPLAGFPPDSGLLKAAMELGWIGLTLTILFDLAILFQGINFYFRMRITKYKVYMLAILAALFAIMVTQYSQVSVGQIPGALFFFSAIALIKRLMEFDERAVNLKTQELT